MNTVGGAVGRRLEQFKAACRKAGVKLTHQRLEIFREIAGKYGASRCGNRLPGRPGACSDGVARHRVPDAVAPRRPRVDHHPRPAPGKRSLRSQPRASPSLRLRTVRAGERFRKRGPQRARDPRLREEIRERHGDARRGPRVMRGLREGDRLGEDPGSKATPSKTIQSRDEKRRAEMNKDSKCPVTGRADKPTASSGTSNRDWWPNQLNLKILHQHSSLSDPMGKELQLR